MLLDLNAIVYFCREIYWTWVLFTPRSFLSSKQRVGWYHCVPQCIFETSRMLSSNLFLLHVLTFSVEYWIFTSLSLVFSHCVFKAERLTSYCSHYLSQHTLHYCDFSILLWVCSVWLVVRCSVCRTQDFEVKFPVSRKWAYDGQKNSCKPGCP